MNNAKIIVVFVVGLVMGAVGGGLVGHKMGSTNRALDRAPVAGMVEVQEERRPQRKTDNVVVDSEPVTQTREEATVAPEETAPEVKPEAVAAATEEFAISPNNDSEIMWVGYKSVLGQKLSMEGGFANFNGTITVENEDPDESFVEVFIDVDQIFSESGILTGVLKGEDFFHTEEYPQARFASTKIEPKDDGYLVTGNFTLRGVTQGIQFPAVIERRNGNVWIEAEFTIDRKLWNVGYDSYEDSLVLGEVVVSFAILATPA